MPYTSQCEANPCTLGFLPLLFHGPVFTVSNRLFDQPLVLWPSSLLLLPSLPASHLYSQMIQKEKETEKRERERVKESQSLHWPSSSSGDYPLHRTGQRTVRPPGERKRFMTQGPRRFPCSRACKATSTPMPSMLFFVLGAGQRTADQRPPQWQSHKVETWLRWPPGFFILLIPLLLLVLSLSFIKRTHWLLVPSVVALVSLTRGGRSRPVHCAVASETCCVLCANIYRAFCTFWRRRGKNFSPRGPRRWHFTTYHLTLRECGHIFKKNVQSCHRRRSTDKGRAARVLLFVTLLCNSLGHTVSYSVFWVARHA